MTHIHERILSDDLPWEPWDRYFRGAPPVDGERGGWVKVIKKAMTDEQGWIFLFKWVGYPDKKIRLTAVVPEGSDEEVYRLEGDVGKEGVPAVTYYLHHGSGTPHGGVYGDDFVSILRYSRGPDIITSYEFIDR